MALLILFGFYELRQERPLIDIRVFRDAAFSASTGMSFVIGFALFAAMVLVPLFLQQVQGYGPYDTRLILASQGLGAGVCHEPAHRGHHRGCGCPATPPRAAERLVRQTNAPGAYRALTEFANSRLKAGALLY